jgi:catechol 2,3-dioxygenase-like lactoylglutathione lyase family enzyme
MPVEPIHLVHSCMVCSDLARSLDFYVGVLAAQPVGEVFDLDAGEELSRLLDFEGESRCKAVFLKWGDDTTYLELQQYAESGTKIPRSTKDVGIPRIGLRVPDIAEAVARIREHRVPLAGYGDVTLPDGRRRKAISVRDPDGLLVEIIEYLELSGERSHSADRGRLWRPEGSV